ncbi:cache domain-containing protein [Pararhizobium haloflavum]|uniref:cache domain-containing protein n=1 Tax=Pararhizobium haloflavum TaxID=2037914 RepID=UPI0012FFE91E|nr:cache domain-containing protein [Pararhizobium haloflavum]
MTTISASSKLRKTRNPVTLAGAVCGFVLVGALVAGLAAATLVRDRVAAFNSEALAAAVSTRANGAELAFARALHDEWQSVQALASSLVIDDPQRLRGELDFAVGDGDRVSWAGFATIDGEVEASSNGLLEGQNVGERPWFQRGLEGPFAGDVHEAVLLASLLPSQEGEPRRFIDLATPVAGADGEAVGVLGYHIDFSWAQTFLREEAEALAVDLFLVSRSGGVIAATDGSTYETLDLQSTRRASSGVGGADVETWPDGRRYLTTVIPQVDYGDLPSFGWRLIARIDADALEVTDRAFSAGILVSLASFGLFLILLTLLFIQAFVRPFAEISQNAVRVADGEDIYPYESRRTAELSRLSAAIARLQGRSPVND